MSMLEVEAMPAKLETWLAASNFDADGRQLRGLAEIRENL